MALNDRASRDAWAMEMVAATAKRSTCVRRSVGCVLLDARGKVLSTGYNGVAAGQAHCNDKAPEGWRHLHEHEHYPNACPSAFYPSGQGLDGCYAIHAEQNALLQCERVVEIDTCYVSSSPCVTCVKLLLNTGARRIVFAERYAHDEASMKLWTRDGCKTWVEFGQYA